MKIDKKKEYVDCVYELLEKEGPSAVSIRRVAKEVGCNSATLYRYFKDFEHLICLASIKYLEPYLEDIRKFSKEIHDPIELNQKLWERFATYSFYHAEIFELMFFGQYKDNLMDFMYEYYDIYSDNFFDLDGFAVSFLFNGDIFERDYMFYRRAAGMGYLTQETAKYLSDIEVYMFHGILLECKQHHYSTQELDWKVKMFRQQINLVIDKFRIK